MDEKKVESITARDVDFAQWYTDVVKKAELIDYSPAKGFMIYRPYGYAIWEQIQAYLDRMLKDSGHENVYMPLVIPESLFAKEKEHVEGFAPECAIITEGGGEKLEDPLIIRPTSETLFCYHYNKIVNSYRDLPKKYNQWCSVVRWEKTTRPFLRGKEFLWQEGHTLHESEQEARHEALEILDYYVKMGRDLLAIPFVCGQKTEKEKFAGAVNTYSLEALMHDGKALQAGTTHYFGDGFARAFDIRYQSKEGKLEYPFQTSWGVSTRLIGSIIMVHGDDEGLVMPPYVAPIQCIVIPIQMAKPGILEQARSIKERLKALGIRVQLDDSDKSPGWKYSEYEMKGVPLRIELGPKDLTKKQAVVVFRHNREKVFVPLEELEQRIPELLARMHQELYEAAKKRADEATVNCCDYEEFKEIMARPYSGYVKMMWCGDEACENKIKEETTATTRCIPFHQEQLGKTCPVCGKPAKKMVYFAKAY
ncbi:MAG: proline--tRNA ligase [Bacilli bacterium]|jgi:prolyl-tRNA synthetase